ncbi:MAG: hypothetical protein K5905_29505 [Roseibium sp.]|uniref:hypothetical protein n=1 Tax=Roseibium sp. TaxID=1936156 RepID=UPI002608F699|nr:hypothetical protein [Roseibium sp.]MCV0429597.1 hypothetical protein [Roseibium sp.]
MSAHALKWRFIILASAGFALSLAGPAWSQSETFGISLELNKAETTNGNCRLSFVMENGTGNSVSSAAYEIVLFDKDGVIDQLSVFDFGDMPVGKTVVRQFELSGLPCAEADRLLINAPSGCSAKQMPLHCSAPLALSSRTKLTLAQ